MAGITALGSENVSMLLGSMTSASSTSSLYTASSIYDNIGTYQSIANGSYGKLLNAYYEKTGETDWFSQTDKATDKTTSTAEQAKVLSSVKEKSDKLATTAAELATTGSKSLFQDVDAKTDKAVEKIQEFVTNYNHTVTAAKKSTDSRTNSRVSAMVDNTENYESKLSSIGISIEEDHTLSVDTDKLKKASMQQLKEVFNGSGSFAATTAQRAVRVGAQASLSSSSSSTYTSSAKYNTTNVQNVYNGFV